MFRPAVGSVTGAVTGLALLLVGGIIAVLAARSHAAAVFGPRPGPAVTNPGSTTGLQWSWRTALALLSPLLAAGVGVYLAVVLAPPVGWLAGGLLLAGDGLAGVAGFLPVRSARIPSATPWEAMFNRRVCDVALGLAGALLLAGAGALLLQAGDAPASAALLLAIAALPVGLAGLTHPLFDLPPRSGDQPARASSAGTP